MAQKMNIGMMDRKISIEEFIEAADDYGQRIKTWKKKYDVWANIYYAGGTEDVEAEKLTAKNEVIFTIRYRIGIDETMRVLYNSNYYQINYIEERGRKNYLKLKCIKKL